MCSLVPGDTEQLGLSSKKTTSNQIHPSQKMSTDLGESLLCSAISTASMFIIFEGFLTNPVIHKKSMES